MNRREHWQDVYRSKAVESVSWYQATPEPSLGLIRAHAAPNQRIVDVGAGASGLVDALLAAGFGNLTVLDVSDEALAKSRARLGVAAARVNWVAADVTTWRPNAACDLWHDRAVFHFLTEADDRRKYRETLAAALAPGGQAIIATFAADGPEKCSGLPVMRYDAPALAAELGAAFVLEESLRHEHTTPAGKVQPFTFCRLRRL